MFVFKTGEFTRVNMQNRELGLLIAELLKLTENENTAGTVVGELLEKLIEIDQNNGGNK